MLKTISRKTDLFSEGCSYVLTMFLKGLTDVWDATVVLVKRRLYRGSAHLRQLLLFLFMLFGDVLRLGLGLLSDRLHHSSDHITHLSTQLPDNLHL